MNHLDSWGTNDISKYTTIGDLDGKSCLASMNKGTGKFLTTIVWFMELDQVHFRTPNIRGDLDGNSCQAAMNKDSNIFNDYLVHVVGSTVLHI